MSIMLTTHEQWERINQMLQQMTIAGFRKEFGGLGSTSFLNFVVDPASAGAVQEPDFPFKLKVQTVTDEQTQTQKFQWMMIGGLVVTTDGGTVTISDTDWTDLTATISVYIKSSVASTGVTCTVETVAPTPAPNADPGIASCTIGQIEVETDNSVDPPAVTYTITQNHYGDVVNGFIDHFYAWET